MAQRLAARLVVIAISVASSVTGVLLLYSSFAAGAAVPARGDAARLLREWGSASGALPFSVLRDRQGNVLATKTGPYSEGELRQLLGQHLQR